ncbi:MAG: hypothetical protein AAB348_03725, partial [Patescibacteria group bacterium]
AGAGQLNQGEATMKTRGRTVCVLCGGFTRIYAEAFFNNVVVKRLVKEHVLYEDAIAIRAASRGNDPHLLFVRVDASSIPREVGALVPGLKKVYGKKIGWEFNIADFLEAATPEEIAIVLELPGLGDRILELCSRLQPQLGLSTPGTQKKAPKIAHYSHKRGPAFETAAR